MAATLSPRPWFARLGCRYAPLPFLAARCALLVPSLLCFTARSFRRLDLRFPRQFLLYSPYGSELPEELPPLELFEERLCAFFRLRVRRFQELWFS